MCDALTAVSIIEEYINLRFCEPMANWEKLEFQKRSYQRSAAYEVCERIMDQPLENPIDIIDAFIVGMTIYACQADGKPEGLMFRIAVETAEELMMLFV